MWKAHLFHSEILPGSWHLRAFIPPHSQWPSSLPYCSCALNSGTVCLVPPPPPPPHHQTAHIVAPAAPSSRTPKGLRVHHARFKGQTQKTLDQMFAPVLQSRFKEAAGFEKDGRKKRSAKKDAELPQQAFLDQPWSSFTKGIEGLWEWFTAIEPARVYK